MYQLLSILALTASMISQCPSEDRLCSKCNGSKCTTCINTYPDSTGKCVEVPSLKVPNCYRHLQNGMCQICDPGYYLAQNFQCAQSRVANCLYPRDIDICTVCIKGIRLANDVCNESSKCGRPNCDTCFENDNCYDCADGYYLTYDGNCARYSNSLKNCRYADINGNCNICKDNYYDRNGECVSLKIATILRMVSVIGVLFSYLLL